MVRRRQRDSYKTETYARLVRLYRKREREFAEAERDALPAVYEQRAESADLLELGNKLVSQSKITYRAQAPDEQ
ncbi:MAG: hypothetical protein ACREDO_09605 [Methyloceanibacter sp.]